MRIITVLVPEGYLEALDLMVKKDSHQNRAEAIRFAIRNLINEHLSFAEKNDLPYERGSCSGEFIR